MNDLYVVRRRRRGQTFTVVEAWLLYWDDPEERDELIALLEGESYPPNKDRS